MLIREAGRADIPVNRDLADKSWRTNYRGILSAEQIDYMLGLMYSENEIFRQLQSLNYRYYILETEQIPIGFLGFEGNYQPKTTKLHRIYLLATEKSKGYGKQAISFLKTQVQLLGNHRIILNVNKHNPAKYFYKSQGFKIISEEVVDIGGGFVMDDYIMEFKIV